MVVIYIVFENWGSECFKKEALGEPAAHSTYKSMFTLMLRSRRLRIERDDDAKGFKGQLPFAPLEGSVRDAYFCFFSLLSIIIPATGKQIAVSIRPPRPPLYVAAEIVANG